VPFLRSAWYAAAWDDEVAEGALFRRKILGEDILLLRGTDGAVRALRNRCAHRFAPLHLGQHCGDEVECGYHGLRYALDGRCVHNPHGEGAISSRVAIRSYPLVARDLLLWIWMGDPERADPANIPAFAGLDPEKFAINRGYLHTPVNYELMTDNIMDLSHIEFLHKGLLGSEAVRRATTSVRQEGSTVYSDRLTHAELLPPALDASFGTEGQPVDRWLDVRWDPPGLMQLVVGVVPTGGPERQGKENPGVHLMTPETENSTHYFWSNARDFRRDDAEFHAQLEAGLRYAFEQQDKPMIEAQQEAMDGEEFWSLKPLLLSIDAGSVRARRVLQQLIREEQEAASR
jgi:vanillate O-demethylase monooxygenase subunit